MYVIEVFSLLLFLFLHFTSGCEDLDYRACAHAQQINPTFCEDDTLSTTVCPKFCNKCPIACFSCNSTLLDYHECKVVKVCQSDEICMRRELKSIIDGHHEYELTCAKKSFCDDPWQGISMFGKRDVSISCCAENLCNYPDQLTTTTQSTTTATTTTPSTTTRSTTQPTTTIKPTTLPPNTLQNCIDTDLMIVVDESSSIDEHLVKQFLTDVISELTIGPSQTLVSFGLFQTSTRAIFDLGDQISKSDTINAINKVTFKGGHGDVNAAINFLMHHATTAAGGDRPNYPNVMLILTDGSSRVLTSQEINLHHRGGVISVEIAPAHYGHLGSNINTIFHIHDENQLANIDHKIATMICHGISSHSSFSATHRPLSDLFG